MLKVTATSWALPWLPDPAVSPRTGREGNGHRDPDGSKRAGLLRNSARFFVFFCLFFFDWELRKTAANGFQNILHLFIAKRADHEVWGERGAPEKLQLEGRAKR